MRSLSGYPCGPAEYHRMALKQGWRLLDKHFSDMVCFGCLARPPERRLPCGHSFCEICLEVFGEPCQDEPYTFNVAECMVCSARFEKVNVYIQPPTAGARILTVDGGGVRGVVALTSLVRLEDTICQIVGVRLPIQKYFDLAIGTSSGIV